MGKKIAVIVPRLKELGPVIVAEKIVDTNKDKYDFDVISLRKNPCEDKERFAKKGINIIELDIKKIPTIKEIKKLKTIILKGKYDVIHSHGLWPDILIGLYINHSFKITTQHNNPQQDYSLKYGKFISKIIMLLIKQYINNFNKVICISNHLKEEYIKFGCREELIVVIYNGVEDQYNRYCFEEKKILRIMSVSVLNKIKNIETAIKTAEQLKKRSVSFEYMIIGDGEERAHLESIVESKKLNQNVKFLGKLSRDEIFKQLNKSHLLIFPSISEGLGLSVLEAQMMGIPVICSDIPVMKEVIHNGINGFRCDTFDESKYAEAIISAFESDKYKYLSEESRQNYLEKFSQREMGERYNQIYMEGVACYDK